MKNHEQGIDLLSYLPDFANKIIVEFVVVSVFGKKSGAIQFQMTTSIE
jgi:ABC-type polysaccharide transport system permease subunit